MTHSRSGRGVLSVWLWPKFWAQPLLLCLLLCQWHSPFQNFLPPYLLCDGLLRQLPQQALHTGILGACRTKLGLHLQGHGDAIQSTTQSIKSKYE